jgi:HCOMODA/2-hydroxy-3-carboxy-muconic semialdehyde decarboxylase
MSAADIQALSCTVRAAARALGRHGLVHAYGHCSVRLDAGRMLVSPAKPLGLVKVGEPCMVVELDGPLPEPVLGEVRVHREIYRQRAEVGGIVRCMPPKIMSLGAMGLTPRARHGFGAYFHPAPPLWTDPQLLRSDTQAVQIASQLGSHAAIVMRGNGAVVVGATLQEAVVLSWYLEDAARVEWDCLAAGQADAPVLTAAQADERATWSGRICERMWDYLTAGDAESC